MKRLVLLIDSLRARRSLQRVGKGPRPGDRHRPGLEDQDRRRSSSPPAAATRAAERRSRRSWRAGASSSRPSDRAPTPRARRGRRATSARGTTWCTGFPAERRDGDAPSSPCTPTRAIGSVTYMRARSVVLRRPEDARRLVRGLSDAQGDARLGRPAGSRAPSGPAAALASSVDRRLAARALVALARRRRVLRCSSDAALRLHGRS